MKKNLVKLSFILFILIVLIAIYYLYSESIKNDQNKVVPQAKNIEFLEAKKWQFPVMNSIVSIIKPNSNVEIFNKEAGDLLFWKYEGYIISLPTTDEVTIQYQTFSDRIQSTKEIYEETPLGTIYNEITKQLTKEGFTLDPLNSTELANYDYASGFKKSEDLCAVIISGDIYYGLPGKQKGVEMKVLCANGLKTAFQEQKPFLDILGFKESNISVAEIEKKGDFVALSALEDINGGGYTLNGARYILKLNKGKYVVVDGPRQDIPLCSTMLQLGIPKDLYINCYDKVGNLQN